MHVQRIDLWPCVQPHITPGPLHFSQHFSPSPETGSWECPGLQEVEGGREQWESQGQGPCQALCLDMGLMLSFCVCFLKVANCLVNEHSLFFFPLIATVPFLSRSWLPV